MSKPKIESRADLFQANAVLFPNFPPTPGDFPPFMIERNLELANLFQREEELAALLSDETNPVDSETILMVVAVAKEIARAGYQTVLVSPDEMVDIAEIYAHLSPETTAVNQLIIQMDPRREYPHLSSSDILDILCKIRKYGPDSSEAQVLLNDLLSNLKPSIPVWTAKVAAALAYLSVERPT